MPRSAGYRSPLEARPPSRADYQAAKERLALLGGETPPKYIQYTPGAENGATSPRPMSNPAYSAYRQAQGAYAADKAMVQAFEGFAATHAELAADLQARIEAGSPAYLAFRTAYLKHLAEAA